MSAHTHNDATEEALLHAALDFVRARGFVVTAPESLGRWEKTRRLRLMFDLSSGGLFKRLRAVGCPPFLRKLARNGKRLREVFLTGELAAFLAQPKQPGRRLAS